MKNQWPFWLFLVGIIIVVIISMNYQGRRSAVSLDDIFPEGEQGGFDYEYVSEEDMAASQDKPEMMEPAQQTVGQEAEKAKAEPAVPKETKIEPKKVAPAEDASKGDYSIQLLSSKDHNASLKALQKAQERGLKGAYVQSVELEGKGTWYRLYAGRYASMDAAKSAASKINKEQYLGAFVVKVSK